MNTIQRLFIEEHQDFINKVIETGEVEHHQKDLAQTAYGINADLGGKEIPDKKIYIETDKPNFNGEQVQSDEQGKYIIVKDPEYLKQAFELILSYAGRN